jgi:hypothetical protein
VLFAFTALNKKNERERERDNITSVKSLKKFREVAVLSW